METNTFESKLKRLEEIVEAMETTGRPLEEVISLFKEGVGLSSQCKSELAALEGQVQKVLAENADGTLETKSLETR